MNAEDGEDGESALPEQLSITRVNDLLAQMRFHEAPKRALFSVPFTLADGFVIGVKGSAVLHFRSRATG
jgi:ATP-dependent DNA helicase 2 subunit 1